MTSPSRHYRDAVEEPEPTAPPDFARWLEAEVPFLRRAVGRWQRDSADVDDLVQDTLVQALANAAQWHGSELRAWLYAIMRNRFLAMANRSKLSAAALEEITAAEAEPTAPPAEARMILRDLVAALRRLPGNQRSAVMLIGVEGKSYCEAAAHMGISVGALRSHLMRGRERLKCAMRGCDARPPFAPGAGAGSS
jgi:RNA polymerase sigma-70 factor (ECF subfamily)